MRKASLLALICALLCVFSGLYELVYGLDEVNAWVYDAISYPASGVYDWFDGHEVNTAAAQENRPLVLSPPVKIAIIDTGVSTKRISKDQVSDGKNYVFDDQGTEDIVGHGTYTAGLIAGAVCEEGALRGIAPSCTLTPLVFYSKYVSGVPKSGDVSGMCAAIYDAIDIYGCKVINISAGLIEDDGSLLAAVSYAEEKGVIVVSAVGNDNLSVPERLFYPAAYDTVVGVGAVDKNLNVLPQSQRNESVSVCAPGSGIRSISIKNAGCFEDISGTSYAAAYVSGMAALLLGFHPAMRPAEFRQILQNTSRDLGTPGYDSSYGFGLMQISDALLNYDKLTEDGVLPFYDVMINDSFAEAVRVMYKNGIMSGVSAARFAPGESMSRGMFTTVLYRLARVFAADDGGGLTGNPAAGDVKLEENPAAGDDKTTGTLATGNGIASGTNGGRFSDVRDDAYYADAVKWATENGIVNGTGDGNFSPDAEITREQMAVILRRYERYSGKTPPDILPGERFSDYDEISDYAKDSVMALTAQGVLNAGPGSVFGPRSVVSRAEAAVTLHWFIKNISEKL